jgi:3-hydroxyacyl-[acyl-carrier protein] dehydratase/trans-2-decenoyl-[acyl-carrier protein] isomerase|tara:strand:- start:524 stop:1048 length:525 start_codon:yes stop_codon:yes gene_type:complete
MQEPIMPSDFPTTFDKEGLLKCARGELFGHGNAQLPKPPMLMMDRVTEISEDGGLHGKGHVIAELDVNPELWFFKCHFPGDPVMPGCLGLDALWQLTGFNLGWRGMPGRGRALGVGEVKFTDMVTPKVKTINYHVDFTRVINRKLKLGMADGRMFADGKEIYTTANMKVGLFTD